MHFKICVELHAISYILLSVFVFKVISAPVPRLQLATDSFPSATALKFMKRFGYLEQGSSDSEALYSQDAIIDAVRTVQRFGALPETGIIDNATLELMASKRCGVPDILRHKGERRRRYIIGAEGWRKREITYFVANWSPQIGEESVVLELQRAFDSWTNYTRLKFRHVMDPSADIIVAFGRGPHGDLYPFDGPGNILAHAFYPYEQGSYGGDIHFDEDEMWRIRPKEDEDGVDFFTVAVHELGHSLGLAHSTVPGSIMFPYYRGHQPNFQLDYDDILAMYQLYILHESSKQEPHSEDGDSGKDDDDRREDDRTGTPTTERSRITETYTHSVPTTTSQKYPNITFVGDDESVDEHIEHDTTRGQPRQPERPDSPSLPNACEGYFDAVGSLRGELFVFKNEFVWRLSRRGAVQEGYPVKFRHLFPQFPDSVKKINAVYERPSDGNIIFFTGNTFWEYDGNAFVNNSPRPLTDYGIPKSIDKIDAAMVWSKNGKTFLFSDDLYWRFNETTHMMDPGYPQIIASRWRGIPPNIDAALTWTDGVTYFFKDNFFWKFDNRLIRVDERYPLPAPQYWIGCPENLDTIWW